MGSEMCIRVRASSAAGISFVSPIVRMDIGAKVPSSSSCLATSSESNVQLEPGSCIALVMTYGPLVCLLRQIGVVCMEYMGVPSVSITLAV